MRGLLCVKDLFKGFFLMCMWLSVLSMNAFFHVVALLLKEGGNHFSWQINLMQFGNHTEYTG